MRPTPRGARALVAAACVPILIATLHPAGDARAAGWDGCVLCGARGLADAISNVLLFVPLGAALRLAGVSWLRGVCLAALLSASIEAAQTVIPGRDPSPPDVLFNVLGQLVGVAASHAAGRLLVARPGTARGFAALWTVLLIGLAAGAGALERPRPPDAPLYLDWTPRIRDERIFQGRLIGVWIGSAPAPDGTADPRVRDVVEGRLPLSMTLVCPLPASELAPVVRIAGWDGETALIVRMGEGRIVTGVRTAASSIGLDAPRVVLPSECAAGDPLRLRLAVRPGGIAARVGARETTVVTGPARSWALITPGPAGNAPLPADLLWIAAWVLPLGLVRLGWRSRAAVAGVLAVVAAAGTADAVEWLALGAAILGGMALGAALRAALLGRGLPAAPPEEDHRDRAEHDVQVAQR